ncbi:MAG TPA: HD domain-containing phosphohydrolase [Miltoncostaeaceae bacterium]|nr:HD domain-containing phosphohydrolase [Miltoncostaeaceae bacterium]
MDTAAIAPARRPAATEVVLRVERWDRPTARHSARVASLAAAVAAELGWAGPDRDAARLGGLLHDVGKIALPQPLLAKRGRLDEGEWALVRRHPQVGADLLAALPGLGTVAAAVAAHHERGDGSGYPFGLSHERIPPLARLLAVVDSYDAMTSARRFRRAKAPTEAWRELVTQAGTRYDTEMVDAFLATIRRFGPAGPRPDFEAALGPVRASLRTGRLEIGAAIPEGTPAA